MKKRIIYSVLLILTVLVSSCESWLDVEPRTKVKSDDLFETEAVSRHTAIPSCIR